MLKRHPLAGIAEQDAPNLAGDQNPVADHTRTLRRDQLRCGACGSKRAPHHPKAIMRDWDPSSARSPQLRTIARPARAAAASDPGMAALLRATNDVRK